MGASAGFARLIGSRGLEVEGGHLALSVQVAGYAIPLLKDV